MTPSVEFAAFFGIDWADERHAVCLLDDTLPAKLSTIDQTPEAIAEWANSIRSAYPGRRVAVALEQSRGALIYALMQYDFLVLFPINPKQLCSYRGAFKPSGAKSDPGDAWFLAAFLREHHATLRVWKPDDVVTRNLRMMCEQRRGLVEERVAHGHVLLQRLKEAYTLALTFKGDTIHTEKFLSLLARFPSQKELQRASPKQLAGWLSKVRVTDDTAPEDLAKMQLKKLRAALPITKDEAVLDASRHAVEHLVKMLRLLNASIKKYDDRIAALMSQHPDAAIFESLPGAGAAMAPRLTAAFGTDREKYASARDMQQMSGIAPVTVESGKSRIVRMRWACQKFLRQTFHEHAAHSLRTSKWAQAYMKLQRGKGHSYQAAVRSLAFKWMRIMHACWLSRSTYSEDQYVERLRAKNSPLIQLMDQAAEPIEAA